MVALLPTDAVRRAGTRVAPIGVRLRLDDSREPLPSPLWGGVGGGGRASLHSCAPRHDPPPHPPPQGGRESLRLNLAPMRVAPTAGNAGGRSIPSDWLKRSTTMP